MSQIVRKGLLSSSTVLTQFQRYRAKINIQRPRVPHYERTRVVAVTQPVFKEEPKTVTCFEAVAPRRQPQLENPYNDIISREIYNWLQHSRMVAIFHVNSISSDDIFNIRVKLHQQNMHLKSYGKKLIAKAVTNTRYEAILPLFDVQQYLVFSTEQRVAELLRVTRKAPQLLLLAGIVDNTLLSRNEFLNYANLPGLQASQAELVQTIQAAPQQLLQHLQTHQNNLVNVLDVYQKNEQS